jgi:preprotein translocase subunit SecE
MARPTRQARRERREQARADGIAPERARPRQQQAVAAVSEPAHPEAPARRRGGLFTFIGECVGELKKVEWPNQRQVMTGTIVVIIACAITGLYLWINDLVWQRIVHWIL